MAELIEIQSPSTVVTEGAGQLVESVSKDTVEVVKPTAEIIAVGDETVVLVENSVIQIISEGMQGPAGPASVNEDEVPYSKRIDFLNDGLLYRGEAQPGAIESNPVWRIRRITIGPDGDTLEEWADGDASFSKRWSDRATLSYF